MREGAGRGGTPACPALCRVRATPRSEWQLCPQESTAQRGQGLGHRHFHWLQMFRTHLTEGCLGNRASLFSGGDYHFRNF